MSKVNTEFRNTNVCSTLQMTSKMLKPGSIQRNGKSSMPNNRKRWVINDYRIFFDGVAVGDLSADMTPEEVLKLEELLNA